MSFTQGAFPLLRLMPNRLFAAAFLPLAAGLLWPAPVSARTQFFSVSAFNGPISSTIDSNSTDFAFADMQTVTIMIAPDPAREAAGDSDAAIEVTPQFDLLEGGCASPADPGTCHGFLNYQVTGGGMDVGFSGDYSTFSGSNLSPIHTGFTFDDTVVLSAGIYTFTAIAVSNFSAEPQTVTIISPTDSDFGLSSANFSVAYGDVTIIPEPGTMAFALLAAFLLLSRRITVASKASR